MKDSLQWEKEFFDFVYERHLIWYKRFVLKEKFPWTKDQVLQKFKIINMYRELDKCTIYLLQKLKDIKDRKSLLLNIAFYRFFNREYLYEELGIEPFEKLDDELTSKIIEKFREKKKSGAPVFNDAYLISSNGKEKEKHSEILHELQNFDFESLVKKIDESKTPEESFEEIKKIPLVGPFLACEIWTDLSYFEFFKQGWNDNDFVNIGPGAKWGLEIMYGKLNKKEQKEKLDHLYALQKKFLNTLEWKKIAYQKAFSNYPYLSITNIEGALCEFRKYVRLKEGMGKKRYFKDKDKE